jgi:hypothetical protein
MPMKEPGRQQRDRYRIGGKRRPSIDTFGAMM